VRWELSEFCEERDRELPIWKVENDQGETVALDLLHEDAKERFNAIDPSEWNDDGEPEYFVYKQDLQGPHHRYSLAMAA
jgi:tRNA(Ile)-lysidine synthase TilS/MesJ